MNKLIVGTDLIRDLYFYKLPNKFRAFLEYKRNAELIEINPYELNLEELMKIDIYIGDRINWQMLDHMPKLKWLHFTNIGSIIPLTHKRNNLIVTNSRNTSIEDSVTEMVVSYMLYMARSLDDLLVLKSDKTMNRTAYEPWCRNIISLKDSTLLIVGCGNIGCRIKKICKAFGMNVLCITSKNSLMLEVYVEMSDFVINLLPLNNKTEKIFNENIFSRMKKNCIFINAGRGKTINQNDLINALKNKKIRAAALDVFEYEPLSTGSELLNIGDVLLSPHIGAYSTKYWDAQYKLFTKNFDNFVDGKKLKNIIK